MNKAPPPTLTRTPVEVHWALPGADGAEADLALLSGDERAAWARMLPEVKRQRVAARAALRRLLGARLGLSPGEVCFARGPFGKPGLSDKHQSRLAFSVSHTTGWSVIALGEVAALGVDIERINPAIEFELLAGRVMSPAERRGFFDLPPSRRCGAFYRAWVVKEAVAKAVGRGLSRGLDDIEVPSVGAGRGTMGRCTLHCAGLSWSVMDLDGPSGLAGALAIGVSELDGMESAESFDRSGRTSIHLDLGIDHAGRRELGHSIPAQASHFLP